MCVKGWGERRGAGGNHRRGNGEGGKGRFWGAGDRQSHRGSALSLTGWGSYPRPQRKGTPSDSTICRPSNHPSLHLQAPGSPHPPFSPAHTAAPAPPQALARSFACLLTSLPFLGYNFAQMRPLAVLRAPPWLPPPAFASGSRSASLAHHGVCLPTLHSPLVSDSSHGRPPLPYPFLLKNLWALAADTLGTPFPSPSLRPCASP